MSKSGTSYSGYPDFFMDCEEYCVVVEAKAEDHLRAEDEVKFYMLNNRISRDVIGFAVSGQSGQSLRVSYFLRQAGTLETNRLTSTDTLLTLDTLRKKYLHAKQEDAITTEALITV